MKYNPGTPEAARAAEQLRLQDVARIREAITKSPGITKKEIERDTGIGENRVNVILRGGIAGITHVQSGFRACRQYYIEGTEPRVQKPVEAASDYQKRIAESAIAKLRAAIQSSPGITLTALRRRFPLWSPSKINVALDGLRPNQSADTLGVIHYSIPNGDDPQAFAKM